MTTRTIASPTGAAVIVGGIEPGGAPRQCQVGGRHYVVTEVHGHWVTGTPWWLTGRDVDTHTWRVTIAPGPARSEPARSEPGRSGQGAVGRVVDLRCTGTHWRITGVGGAR